MNGYIKYFDDGGKNMTFVTDNEKVYDKYIEIWEVIRKLLKVKFAVNPVRDDKYLIAKLKIFNKINRTTFNDDNNKNNIPKERSHYICIPAIDIDSVLKIDNKIGYPQVYLEQCKYKLKKRKIVNYIDDEIIDEDSDDAVDNHLNSSVPDSYVEIRSKISSSEHIIMEDKIIIKNYLKCDNENILAESAVLDLYSRIDVDFKVGLVKNVNTGISISLPKNFYASIKKKSSLESKGLSTLGGFIDKNYSKEIIILMYSLTKPIKNKKGEKIAQLIISNKKTET